MPLSKLQNFIKNTEGKILYVNPNDIGATDSIDNQGNSLSQPFKTIQRALIESARFSYVRGNDNDLFDRTTILLFPGEHLIDNRPGFKVKDDGGIAKAISPSGVETNAQSTLTLSLESVFNLDVEDNMLYKFNSINGGCILPRGTSIVGLDLRKTKIRPLYVPNPTDSDVPKSALIRLTGTCYFRDFTLFDGPQERKVYTDNQDFSETNQSTPSFSHHKLTGFEFADGVTVEPDTGLTDLDMYYAKLSNAFNESSGRNIDQKFPADEQGFSKSRIEYEIVGAFASDPVKIESIISGDGASATQEVTVRTQGPHGLTVGTPVKIRGASPSDYNISTFVRSVPAADQFTYLLPFVDPLLAATAIVSGATVTIETDTVTGASPYVFNCSLRSVFGMNGMNANGKTATGFRSMVVAQYTAVSLQKDDRAFVKYNPVSRTYDGIPITKVTGAELSSGSSSTNTNTVYHLDSTAIYRTGWGSSHIKMENDSIIQVVSVFAIGFNAHFLCETGGDASITNSNSNFGQIALISSGFKKESFAKDDQGYVTSIIAPQSIDSSNVRKIDLVTLDVGLTTSVGISSHIYLFGFKDADNPPQNIVQGFRVGAKQNDKLFVDLTNVGDRTNSTTYEADILITDNLVSAANTAAVGQGSKERITKITSVSTASEFDTTIDHNLITGEKIRIFSENGDLPENLKEETIYFCIKVSNTEFKVASTSSDALRGVAIQVYGGTGLRVESRVSDHEQNEIGCPILFDPNNNNWFIHVNENNEIYNGLLAAGQGVVGLGEQTSESYIRRTPDNRSLGDKIYKLRYFIPKESTLGRNPVENFVLQDSSTTSLRNDQDFTISTIDLEDFDYKRNPRYIATCTAVGSVVTIETELPHNINVGDTVKILDAKSTTNEAGVAKSGYNGEFVVTTVGDELTFQYNTTDVDGDTRLPGDFNTDVDTRDSLNARYERVNNQINATIYRSEVIQEHIPNISDGIYHFNVLTADNFITEEFTQLGYLPRIENFFPQLDRDNPDTNPRAAKSFAKRDPIGDVAVDDPENSITRESIDTVYRTIGVGRTIIQIERNDVAGIATVTLDRPHNFAGIATYTSLTGGSGFTEGEYYNVKLLNDGTSTHDGATAKVVVGSGGAVESVEIQAPGSAYTDGEVLDLSGFSGAEITINTSGISTAVDNAIQLTGIGSTADASYRIDSIPSTTKVAFAYTSGDTEPVLGQYLVNVGRSIGINTIIFTSDSSNSVGVATITTNNPHGFISGNSFQILDTNNNHVGQFNVLERVGILTITTRTDIDLQTNPNYLLPTAFDAKGGTITDEGENLGSRGFNFFANESALLSEDIGEAEADNQFKISLPNSGIGTAQRFSIGDYIDVDGEIMRITTNTLLGPANDEIGVIRGYLGSQTKTHQEGTQIRKINVYGTELRRPSILRASGHTFEYLGYGPGNYSTGLPQVQNITLTDKEEFLTQSQQRSGGIVVYTAMNNDGDFFIGNKIINPSTGEESTFNAPIPTVRGENPSVLSVIFDEVIVKERLVVEGGASKTLLSQFDGPLTVNNVMNINGNTKIDANLEVTGSLKASGSLDITGSLNVQGIATFVGAITGEGGATLGDIEVGIGLSTNEIEATTDDLSLRSSTNLTRNYGDLDVVGTLSAQFLNVPNIPPIGHITLWAGTLAGLSTYYRVCDGRELDQTEFSELYDALTEGGTVFPYGANPSGSTFLIPNLIDRFPVAAGIAYTTGGTGGSTDAVIVDHTHTVTNTAVVDHIHDNSPSGSHNHAGQVDNDGIHLHTVDPIGTHTHSQVDPAGIHAHTVQNSVSHNHGNTDSQGAHGHTINSQPAHAHGQVDPVGNHTHDINTQPTHGHGETGNAGNHGHGVIANGSHNHNFSRRTGSVEYGNRNQNASANSRQNVETGNAGNHGHNVNQNGSHNHNVGAGGQHAHGGETGGQGTHTHETNPGGSHGHTTAGQQGGHVHETNPGGVHNHTAQQNGTHTHETNPGGSHTHTTQNNAGHQHAIPTQADHDHAMSQAGGHNHPVVATPTGVTAVNNNLPPYYGLYYVIRCK